MKRLATPLASIVLLVSAVGTTVADTRITTEERSEISLPGNESETTTEITLWFREDRAARVDSTGRIISRLDRGESYVVNDAEQTYSVVEIETDSSPGVSSAKLEKSGERRQIGSWMAERYDVTFDHGGDTGHAVLWVSTDVDVDMEAYRAFGEGVAAASGMNWLQALASLEGYPVLQEVSIGAVKVTSKVLAIAEESPPPGIYEPPQDYERQE